MIVGAMIVSCSDRRSNKCRSNDPRSIGRRSKACQSNDRRSIDILSNDRRSNEGHRLWTGGFIVDKHNTGNLEYKES